MILSATGDKRKNVYFLIMVFAACLALSFILYGNTIGGEFISDDNFFVSRPELRSFSYLSKIWLEPLDMDFPSPASYRPLAIFSFALNFIIFEESPVSFHVINIILNGLVIFLVFLLVRRLFSNTTLAALSALLFAFFPIHVEMVASIKSRDEILATIFALLAWLLFIKATESESVNYKKIAVSSFLWFLAVLSKEYLIIVPALFLAVFWVKERARIRKVVKAGLCFLPIAFIYLAMRYAAVGKEAFDPQVFYFSANPLQYVDIGTRIWTAFKTLFLYVFLTFVPVGFATRYGYNQLTLVSNPILSWQAMGGIAMLVLLIWLLLNKKYRQSPLLIGALTFFIPYFIFSNFILTVSDIFGERWVYFSSIGLAIIGGWLLMRLYEFRKVLGVGAMIIIAVLYGAILISRNHMWLTHDLFVETLLKTSPESVDTQTVAAKWYISKGDFERARECIAKGTAIYKEHPDLLEVKSVMEFYDGNYEIAKEDALDAMEHTSHVSAAKIAYVIYAMVLAKENKYQDSINVVEFTINQSPKQPRISRDVFQSNIFTIRTVEDNPAVRFILAVDYYKLGDTEEAKRYFDWNQDLTEAEKIKMINEF